MPTAAPARPRSSFVRTEVPSNERTAGIATVVLLGVIGAAFLWKGQHYDPTTYQPDPTKLESAGDDSLLPDTAPSLPGATGLIGSSSGAAAQASAPRAAGKAVLDPATAAVFDVEVYNLVPGGEIELYNTDTLYEKINGRAPAYQQYNFAQLACRSYQIGGNEAAFVDLYLYDMASPAGAYGIFSLERDPTGKPVAFAGDGYESEGSYFFRKGRFYVQILASGPETAEASAALAQAVAERLAEDNSGLEGRSLLPTENQLAGSAELISVDAQGMSFLKEVHQATYQFNGAELRFFLMAAPDPATAASGWDQYKSFCEKYGKVTGVEELSGARIFQGVVLGGQRVIFVRGNRLGGVFEGTDPAAAKAFVADYLKSGATTP